MRRDLRAACVPTRDTEALRRCAPWAFPRPVWKHPVPLVRLSHQPCPPTTPMCDFTGLALRPNILPRKRKGPEEEAPTTQGAHRAHPGSPESQCPGEAAPTRPGRPRSPSLTPQGSESVAELGSRWCSGASRLARPGSRLRVRAGDLGLRLRRADPWRPHPPSPTDFLSKPTSTRDSVRAKWCRVARETTLPAVVWMRSRVQPAASVSVVIWVAPSSPPTPQGGRVRMRDPVGLGAPLCPLLGFPISRLVDFQFADFPVHSRVKPGSPGGRFLGSCIPWPRIVASP